MSLGIIAGTALKYEADDVNTDVIWPGKYTYVQVPPEQMPEHAMETFDPEFKHKVKLNDLLVVGRNFGCGSSREQASECLRRSGVKAVVARSFARIFYRNSINLGLPVVEAPEVVDAVETGTPIRIDLSAGLVEAAGRRFEVPRFPPFVLELLEDGGLIAHIRKQRQAGGSPQPGPRR